MSLSILPTELVLFVAEGLGLQDLHTLIQVNHRFTSFVVLFLQKISLDQRYTRRILYWGAASGNREVVKFVLERGSRTIVCTREGTYSNNPPGSGDYKLEAWYLEKTPRPCRCRCSKVPENDNIIEIALRQGPNLKMVELGSHSPISALHWAIRHHHHPILRLLFRKNVDVTVKSAMAVSALHEAIESNNSFAVRVLLEKEAESTGSYIDSLAAWHIPYQADNMACLIYERVNPNGQLSIGHNVIGVAASQSGPKTTEILINRGADINMLHYCGRRPITLALMSKNYETAKLLLEKGAEISSVNNKRGSILHMVLRFFVREWKERFVIMLIERGIDVNIQDRYGRSPLHIAVRYQAPKAVIMRLLELFY